MKYIIHDLTEEEEKDLKIPRGYEVLHARKKHASCSRCIGCWVKTPGMCVLKDGIEELGRNMLISEGIIIISKIVLGGFSSSVKELWDRCIPESLPHFKRVKEEHYDTTWKQSKRSLMVYFYETTKTGEYEKTFAKNIVEANALNLMAKDSQVHFLNTIDDIKNIEF